MHYHPAENELGQDGRYEFIELKNTGTAILDISGLSFVDGIEYTFPPETELKPKEFIVLAANDDYFYERYNFWPFEDYKGQLNNDGEWLALLSPLGDTICNFKYNDGIAWPQTPDGMGNSLVPVDYMAGGDENDPTYWRASHQVNGSPGEDDYVTAIETPFAKYDKAVFLSQNYPNPFSDITFIDFELNEASDVNLSVFDITGRNVAVIFDGTRPAGLHQVEWDGSSQKPGLYYLRLTVKSKMGTTSLTKKMLKLK